MRHPEAFPPLKGHRTRIMHLLAGCVSLAGIFLQYLDMLGLSDAAFGWAAIGLNVIVNLGGWYLRGVTTTAVGESE